MASKNLCYWTNSDGEKIYLTFVYSVSQSITNNTSKITYTLKCTRSSDHSVQAGGFKLSIDGNVVYSKSTDYRIALSNGTEICTGSKTLTHNADGTRSFKVSVEAAIYTYAVNTSGSATITLSTIPRASIITSASNITLGNNCSIKWTPASKSFKYKIKFSLGTWSYTTGYISPSTTSAYTYSGYIVPASNDLYELLPNSVSGTMTATLTTYNSNKEKIGSANSKTFTVTIPSSVKPTIGDVSVSLVSYKTDSKETVLIRNKNKLKIIIGSRTPCTPGFGSSIVSYTLSGSGVNISINTNSTSATFNEIGPFDLTGDLSFNVTVKDTRGRSGTYKLTVDDYPLLHCYNYNPPSFTKFIVQKCDSDGTSNDNGEYIKIDYAASCSYGKVDESDTQEPYPNSLSYTFYYSPSDGEGIIELNPDTNVSTSGGFSTSKNYTIWAVVTDSYGGTATSNSIVLFSEERPINISCDKKGVAIGKKALGKTEQGNGLFECQWEAQFENKVSAPNFNQTSDKRLKQNIQDIDFNLIDELRPVSYQLISDKDGHTHYGLIAQEVIETLGRHGIDAQQTSLVGTVHQKDSEWYSLAYNEIIPFLVKKCQEMQREIDRLKTLIDI